jgi:hypothetical protein
MEATVSATPVNDAKPLNKLGSSMQKDANDSRTSGHESTKGVPGWQPIETAPRDGSEIVVYRPLAHETSDPHITIARTVPYPRTSPQGVEHYTDRVCHPTHWMPLPNPPETTR